MNENFQNYNHKFNNLFSDSDDFQNALQEIISNHAAESNGSISSNDANDNVLQEADDNTLNRELTLPPEPESDASISLVDNNENTSAECCIKVVAVKTESDNIHYVDIPEGDYSTIPLISDSRETTTSQSSQVQTIDAQPVVASEVSRLEKNKPPKVDLVSEINSTDEGNKKSRKCKPAVLTDPAYIENIKKAKRSNTKLKKPENSAKKRKTAAYITNQQLTAVSLQVCTPPYPGYNYHLTNFLVVSSVSALNHQMYSLPNNNNLMLKNSLGKENQQYYLTPPPINMHSGSLQNLSTSANVPQYFTSIIHNKLINVTSKKSQSVSSPLATNILPVNLNQQMCAMIPSQAQINSDYINPVLTKILPANINQPIHSLTPGQSQMTHGYSQIATNSGPNFLSINGNPQMDTETPALMTSRDIQSVSNSADPCKSFVQGNMINSVSTLVQRETPTKFTLSNFVSKFDNIKMKRILL